MRLSYIITTILIMFIFFVSIKTPEKKLKKINKNMKKYLHINKIKSFIFALLILITTLVFLPYIGILIGYYSKVNGEKTNLSRLEFVKLTIALISPILTFIVFKNTLKMQEKTNEDLKKQRETDKKLEINKDFNNLLNLFMKKQQFVMNKNTDILNDHKDSLLTNDIEYINGLNDTSPLDYIALQINGSHTQFVSFSENYGYKDDTIYSGKKTAVRNFEEEFAMLLSYILYPNSVELIKKGQNRIAILNLQYESIYDFSGPYFKTIHRIIKLLNSKIDKKELLQNEYKMYIGILRTQLNSKEFIFILYNSLYITRGIGLGIQLVGTGLFGDGIDFDINQHFKTPDDEKEFLDIFLYSKKNIKLRKSLEIHFNTLKKKPDKFKKIVTFKDFYEDYQKKSKKLKKIERN